MLNISGQTFQILLNIKILMKYDDLNKIKKYIRKGKFFINNRPPF